MSIEKKSLISTLKTTRKANAAKEDISGSATTVSPAQLLPIKKLAIKKQPSTKKAVNKHLTVSKGGARPVSKGGFKPVTKGGLGGVKPVAKN